MKRESSTVSSASVSHETTLQPKAPSPFVWNLEVRHEKLETEGVVEIPKIVAKYENTQRKLREKLRRVESKLANGEELRLAQKRGEKGKPREKSSSTDSASSAGEKSDDTVSQAEGASGLGEQYNQLHRKSWSEPSSDKLGKESAHNKSRVSSSSETDSGFKDSQALSAAAGKEISEDLSHKLRVINAGQSFHREQLASQPLNQASKSEGSKSKGNGPIQAWARRCYEDKARPPLNAPKGPKSWYSEVQPNRTQGSRSLQQDLSRREVNAVALRPDICTCRDLPKYFTRTFNPSFHEYNGSQADFIMHIRQIANKCRGHPQKLIDACRRILRPNRSNVLVCSVPVMTVSLTDQRQE